MKCLLVEDNPYALDMMVIFLNKHGIDADIAANGQIGLQKYLEDTDSYCVIFMDLQMPVLDGYEATRLIRRSNLPGAGTIPIVAMSGEPPMDPNEYGFTGFLRKPFQLNELLSVIVQQEPTN